MIRMREMSPLSLISIKTPVLCHYHWCDKYVYDCQGDNKHFSNCFSTFWSSIIALEVLPLSFSFKLLVKKFLFVCLYEVFRGRDFFRAHQITKRCWLPITCDLNFLCVWEFVYTEVITFSCETPTLVKNGKLSYKGCTACLWTRWIRILGPSGPPLIVKCCSALRSLL